ncbi:MAG TPA: NAD(P)H-dependent oxidoreductase [Alphaproteobacteria bacterium]|jgi:chromate reductase
MAKTIALLIGSLRKDSMNRKFAKALEKLAGDRLKFQEISIDLPAFNQDQESDPPALVATLRTQVLAADGVLIVTPEYNRSIPGLVKNALDWGSRPYGKNVWANKPVATCGASGGAIGSALAQAHLRNVLAYLDMPTLLQPEVYLHFTKDLIDDAGNISKEDTQKFLGGFVDKYVAWVEKHA